MPTDFPDHVVRAFTIVNSIAINYGLFPDLLRFCFMRSGKARMLVLSDSNIVQIESRDSPMERYSCYHDDIEKSLHVTHPNGLCALIPIEARAVGPHKAEDGVEFRRKASL